MNIRRERFVIVMIVSAALTSGCDSGNSRAPVTGGSTPENQSAKAAAKLTDDPLPLMGRMFEFSGKRRDQSSFHSLELAGLTWMGVLIDDDISRPPAVGTFIKMAEIVRTHPQAREIRLLGIRPAIAPGQVRTPMPLVPEWTMVDVGRSVVDQWRSQFQPPEVSEKNVAAQEAAGFEFSSDEDVARIERAMVNARIVLVDATGRIRGSHYDLTGENVQLIFHDMHKLFTGRKGVPEGLFDAEWVRTSWKTQNEKAKSYGPFHDFQFIDRRIESGIRFRNKVVDDAGRDYLAGHYDHGNGVAVADVDLDGLDDIYFANQVGGGELWRNRGGGEFENVTAAAGLSLPDRIGVAAAFADIDNDGDPDLFVTTTRGGNVMFENDGTGRFRDISQPSGTDYVGHSSGAIFFDFNRDGRLDLFVANVGRFTTDEVRTVTMESLRNEPPGTISYYRSVKDAFASHLKPERSERSLLYENTGNNVFRDVTEAMGIVDECWCGDASPLDVNADGWPDLYLTNMQGNDEYYENQMGVSFVKKSWEVFPRTPWGTMGIRSFDFDNDGDMDLFLTDMHSDMSQQIAPDREKLKADMKFPESFLKTAGQSIFGNAFFRNDGPEKFTEISDEIGAENYWPWGVSTGDLNADGFADVFIASGMNLPFRYGINSVLLNDQGRRFLDAEFVLGVEPRRGWQVAIPWYEVHCDGADRGHLDCKGRTGTVPVWAALGSRSSVVFDLDSDGDLDIVTNDFNSEPLVLISDLSDRKPDLRFLKVSLQGRKSNRQGLGAVVRVKLGDSMQTQVSDGKSGYLSQSALPLYFGLGSASEVMEVEVVWPSGHRQTVPGPIRMNSQLLVTEDSE